MIILDTDLLTLVQRANSVEYQRLVQRLDAANDVVCVTIVSFEEQMRGWLSYSARARSLPQQVRAYSRLHELLADFQTRPVVDFDDHAATEFQRLVKLRLRVGTMDLRIAAIAFAQSATLLSRNLADFRKVPDLSVEDWTSPVPP